MAVTDSSSVPAAQDGPGQALSSLAKLEAIVVAFAAPFLFFPTLSLAATLAALVALAVVWLLPALLQRRPGLPPSPFNVALIPWTVLLGMAILVSADPAQSLPKATGVILGLAVWRVLTIFARSRALVSWQVIGFLGLGAVLIFAGLTGIDETAKIPALEQFNPFRALAVSTRFDLAVHPNQVAGLIALYLPLVVALFLGWDKVSGRRIGRIALAALALLVALALLLTQSRGGWVGAAAGLLVLLISWSALMPASPRRTAARALAAILIIAGAVTLLWIGPARLQAVWLDPPRDTAVGTFATLVYRQELWPWALAAARDFAFTGVGLGAFREVAFRLYPVPISPAADIGHAHNIFLQTALDVGLPGLVAYVALLAIAFGGAWSVASRDAAYRPISLGLLAGLVGLHVYGLADALALGSKPGIMFWYALGLIAAMCLTARPRATSTGTR